MKISTYILLVISFFTASASLQAQCFEDGHSPFQNDGWLSCETSVGPIAERGDAHWLLYDFGEEYVIDSLYFWNHNVWGETGMGVEEILIDFSTDQENWTTVGPFEIEEAPGSWRYTGTSGPSLLNQKMRYVLITVLSTHDEALDCAGFSEVRFNIGEATNTEDIELVGFDIAPNPASDFLNVSLENQVDIQALNIYNSVGQLIKRLPSPAGDQMIVPITELNDGMYYLSITSDAGIATKSFVKVGR